MGHPRQLLSQSQNQNLRQKQRLPPFAEPAKDGAPRSTAESKSNSTTKSKSNSTARAKTKSKGSHPLQNRQRMGHPRQLLATKHGYRGSTESGVSLPGARALSVVAEGRLGGLSFVTRAQATATAQAQATAQAIAAAGLAAQLGDRGGQRGNGASEGNGASDADGAGGRGGAERPGGVFGWRRSCSRMITRRFGRYSGECWRNGRIGKFAPRRRMEWRRWKWRNNTAPTWRCWIFRCRK